MNSIYILKNKDIIIGEINILTCTFKLSKDYTGGLPHVLYPYGKTKDYQPTYANVREFIKTRAVQNDYQGVPYILDELNIGTYDPVVMIPITYGMMHGDFMWLVPLEHKDDWKFDYNHMEGKYYKGPIS